MKTNKAVRLSLLAGFIILTSLQNAWAATVGFSDPGSLIPKALFSSSVGSTFDIDIVGTDFAELAGGVIDLGFDPGVIQINTVNVNDTLFAFIPDGGAQGAPGSWLGIGFDVDVIVDDPIATGAFSIATINLTLLTGGGSALSILGTSEFFSTTVELFPATADATVSAVPVPPAIWLMASGLGLLLRAGRKHGE